MTQPALFIAFAGDHRLAFGPLREVAVAVKFATSRDTSLAPLVFEAETSRPVEIDLRGSATDVVARLPKEGSTDAGATSESPSPRGPGRPKLGVVAREVTLLPRHWDWLATQPGGASVAIRKLVEDARRATSDRDRVRQAQEAAYRFMAVMAGNRPNYEDALRALYAGDAARFDALIAAWPEDIRDHSARLAGAAFDGAQTSAA
jgi:hypothetical protein